MRRITLAVSLSLLCDALLYLALVPLIPHYAERFGLSKLGAGLVLAALPLTILVTTVPLGLLAARSGARRATVAGNAAFTVATAAFAFAPDVEMLVLARVVQGLASSVTWGASIAWLTENVPRTERGTAVGQAMGVVSFGAIAGPAIGALGGATSPTLAFLVIALVAGTATVAAWWAPDGIPNRGPSGSLRQTLVRVARHPLVIAAVAVGLIDASAAAVVNLLGPIALHDAGHGAVAIGSAIVAGSVVGVALARPSGRIVDRIGAGSVAVLGGALSAAMMAALALDPAPSLIFAVLVLTGPLFAFMATAVYALAAAGADALAEPHSAPTGILNLTWSGGLFLGQVAAGALGERAGDRAAYATAALVIAALAAVCLVAGRRAAGRAP